MPNVTDAVVSGKREDGDVYGLRMGRSWPIRRVSCRNDTGVGSVRDLTFASGMAEAARWPQ